MTPSVGRILWFYPDTDDPVLPLGPLAAIVAHIIDDLTVNLTVSAPTGETYARCRVTFVQTGGDAPNFSYCTWPAKTT